MGEVQMIDHDELVAEIPNLEKLSAQDRLERAKERRFSQLQRWEKRLATGDIFPPPPKKPKAKGVKFQPNITLIEASARNDAEEVEYLISNGFSSDLQNEDGLSALHQAVIEDCEDVVHTLVEHGAALNIKDADLWTPLHAAVACGNYDLVSYLVDKGASLVEINADGNMPIDLCEDNEDIEKLLDTVMGKEFTEEELENLRNAVSDEMLQDLRDSVIHGRDLSVVDERGATAMHIAAANGYLEVLEYLLEHEIPFDVRDEDGWQPIHAAACWGQDKAIELLFQHGADLDAKTKLGETPVDLSEDEDLVEMMTDLKQNGRKTKELKRSQSNSSRTLCVRRSSIVDKHRMSLNDAKSEGMILQSSPDYKEVFLTTGVDPRAGVNRQLQPMSTEKQESLVVSPHRQTEEVSPKHEQKGDTLEPVNVSVGTAQEEKEVKKSDVKADDGAAGDSTVKITIRDNQIKTEFKKEASQPTKLESGNSEESAPIAKRESDAPRRGVQSPSDVTVTVNDSPASSKERETSPNSRNTAASKLGNSEAKDNNTPKKKCCVIL